MDLDQKIIPSSRPSRQSSPNLMLDTLVNPPPPNASTASDSEFESEYLQNFPTLYPSVIVDNPTSDANLSPASQYQSTRPKRKRNRKSASNSPSTEHPTPIQPPPKTQPPTTKPTTPATTTQHNPNTHTPILIPILIPTTPAANKTPAIHIYTRDNHAVMRRIASARTIQPVFKFNNTTLICIPKLHADHTRIIKLMADRQIEYFTHNSLTERPVKLVAKYIPLDIPEAEIIEDLKAKELPPTPKTSPCYDYKKRETLS